jgi:hypothetical protein
LERREREINRKHRLHNVKEEMQIFTTTNIIPFWLEGNRDTAKEIEIKVKLASFSGQFQEHFEQETDMRKFRQLCTKFPFESHCFQADETRAKKIGEQWEKIENLITSIAKL